MSVSLNVYAFRAPDAAWLKMRAVWDACEAAGIDPPAEVEEFFDGEAPDPAGVSISLEGRLREWRGADASGFELSVADIPAGVQTLRWTID